MKRRRVALLSSETLRAGMAGIGIRYAEIARGLAHAGLEVVLITPGDPEATRALQLPLADLRPFVRGALRAALTDCAVVVTQGQLANDAVLEADVPVVVDLYDPFLIENMHYLETLGLDPYRNDHASWVLQMSRGDFFLCSCEEQRLFYAGFLTALGRVHPRRVAEDPDLRGLIAAVPFGVPGEVPPHRPVLPPRREGERRLLFGGLYDWYDPWPLLEAVDQGRERGWTLLFIRIPNSGTPQRLLDEVEAWARRRGLWGEVVQVHDWVPSDRRYDLLRDADVLVATHRLDLETHLSLRTRFLDAFAVGLPVLATEGGAIGRLLREREAGWLVPPSDPRAIEAALRQIFAGGEAVAGRLRAAADLAQDFRWERVLEPLIEFCRRPRLDSSKDDFAFRPPTQTPNDSLLFRLRRRWRRWTAAQA